VFITVVFVVVYFVMTQSGNFWIHTRISWKLYYTNCFGAENFV